MEKVVVNNAGILLLQFFIPRMFRLAGYLDGGNRKFEDEESKVRAVFMLQYLAYGEEKEYAERELYLNKVLVGIEEDMPLPTSCKLNEEEIKIVEEMISMIKKMWNKVEHITNIALRMSFFQREGEITKKENGRGSRWFIEVKEKPYDVLLDSLPWAYAMYRYPWMEEIVEVKWR